MRGLILIYFQIYKLYMSIYLGDYDIYINASTEANTTYHLVKFNSHPKDLILGVKLYMCLLAGQ
jgi:hypothetical protein